MEIGWQKVPKPGDRFELTCESYAGAGTGTRGTVLEISSVSDTGSCVIVGTFDTTGGRHRIGACDYRLVDQ